MNLKRLFISFSICTIMTITSSAGWSESFRYIDKLDKIIANTKMNGNTYFYLNTVVEENIYKNGNLISSSTDSMINSQQFVKVDKDLNTVEFINLEEYKETTTANSNENKVEIIGIPYSEINFKNQGTSILVDTLKLTNVKPVDSESETYTISHVYRIRNTTDSTYYFVKIEDNIPHINNFSVNKLIKVEKGKQVQSLSVYNNLEYIKNDFWRSSYNANATTYVRIHEFGKNDIFAENLIFNKLLASNMIIGKNTKLLKYIGYENRKYIYALIESRDGFTIIPDVKFVELNSKNEVRYRSEKSRCVGVDNKYWIYKDNIYELYQDNQIIRNLTKGNKIFINGSKSLGSFARTNEFYTKYRIPLYSYRAKQYVCLEDLTALGYTMKWDGTNRIVSWLYTGKRKIGTHNFKSFEIYDNNVFANIEGRSFHIYNAEGYSLICVDDLNQIDRISSMK